MFIETLEFTIPVDLCDLFSTLKDGPRSNMEFPASVNSYGTTQDASIQVVMRANKLTFVVDGVSSNASMISKSECKTLRLSVFDVDRTLIAQECVSTQSVTMEPPSPVSVPSKRSRDFSGSQQPRTKSSRTSFSDSPPVRSPAHNSPQSQIKPRPSNNTQSKPSDSVNVKQEPEDPDLIEIEPDPEPDIEPKKEVPFMQIDYSSDVPHTQTSQAALERVSFPSSSRSHSSPSSFHQNVPHVQDFNQPGPSHGDQSGDDFLVFQDDNDYGDNENSADYSNDDGHLLHGNNGASSLALPDWKLHNTGLVHNPNESIMQVIPNLPFFGESPQSDKKIYPCPECQKQFTAYSARLYHIESVHRNRTFPCVCGKVYKYQLSLSRHSKACSISLAAKAGKESH